MTIRQARPSITLTSAATALTVLRQHLRQRGAVVADDRGAFDLVLPSIDVRLRGSQAARFVYCHTPAGETELIFCTNACMKLGTARQAAEVADRLIRLLREAA